MTKRRINTYTRKDGTVVIGHERDVHNNELGKPDVSKLRTILVESDDYSDAEKTYMMEHGVSPEVFDYLKEKNIYISPQHAVNTHKDIMYLYDNAHKATPSKSTYLKVITSATDPDVPTIALLGVHADIGTASLNLFAIQDKELRDGLIEEISDYASTKGYNNIRPLLMDRRGVLDGEIVDPSKIRLVWENMNFPSERMQMLDYVSDDPDFLSWVEANWQHEPEVQSYASGLK